jgi:aminoglycoside phosphotransferase (APT) family kinase protein
MSDPMIIANTLRREASAMEQFAIHCPVPTPRHIGLGQPGADYPMPWAIQSWAEGTEATPDGASASRVFALDIANLISSLRKAETRGIPFGGRGRGGSLRDHDQWMETCFGRSEPLLDVPRLRELWKSFRELPMPSALAMCHKDLIPANLLTSGERLVGVLDGGGFAPADPALDLVAAWHLFEQSERGVLKACLGCSDLEWHRGAAWAFQQSMGLVWYYDRTHPGMAELGRSTLARIVNEQNS